jgi:hypothetical protein
MLMTSHKDIADAFEKEESDKKLKEKKTKVSEKELTRTSIISKASIKDYAETKAI